MAAGFTRRNQVLNKFKTMPSHPSQTEADADTPREHYERVLRTVEYQTTPKQLPGVRPETVLLILCNHAGHDRDAVQNALKQAESNDDVVVWRDADGHARATRCTEADLQRLLGHFNTDLQAPADACRRIAELIREVRDGSD